MSHVAPKSLYFTIFGALLALTALTVGVTYIDLGRLNLVVALAIAVTKATLVVLFFMHAWWSERLIHVTIMASLMFLAFLAVFGLADYLTRSMPGVPGT